MRPAHGWTKAGWSWIQARRVMLMSEESTEFAATVQSPLVNDTYPQLITSVCNLGVLLDSLLMLSSSLEWVACYCAQLFKRLHLLLVVDYLPSIISALVTYQLGYSNTNYVDMKQSACRKLQLLQNTAVQLLWAHQTCPQLSTLAPQEILSVIIPGQGLCSTSLLLSHNVSVSSEGKGYLFRK